MFLTRLRAVLEDNDCDHHNNGHGCLPDTIMLQGEDGAPMGLQCILKETILSRVIEELEHETPNPVETDPS